MVRPLMRWFLITFCAGSGHRRPFHRTQSRMCRTACPPWDNINSKHSGRHQTGTVLPAITISLAVNIWGWYTQPSVGSNVLEYLFNIARTRGWEWRGAEQCDYDQLPVDTEGFLKVNCALGARIQAELAPGRPRARVQVRVQQDQTLRAIFLIFRLAMSVCSCCSSASAQS
jgi:hypothetical protein